jgi:hypothetical protein
VGPAAVQNCHEMLSFRRLLRRQKSQKPAVFGSYRGGEGILGIFEENAFQTGNSRL